MSDAQGAAAPGDMAADLAGTLSAVRGQLGSAERSAHITFLLGCVHADGGFRGRTGNSDLTYTCFGAECLAALGEAGPRDRLRAHVLACGDGQGLDFVRLVSLARCRRALAAGADAAGEAGRRLLGNLEAYRTSDGGYGLRRGGADAEPYAGWLALLAYHSLGEPVPAMPALVRSLQRLRGADRCSFTAEPGGAAGSTPATAAAVLLHVAAREPLHHRVGEWLLAQVARDGGFLAGPGSPAPDLHSTAMALYALRALSISPGAARAPCRTFVESLRAGGGGFCGHGADPTPDCEYTWYGLLSLALLANAECGTQNAE